MTLRWNLHERGNIGMKISSLREYIALNVKLGQVMIKATEKKKRTITREEANRVIIEDSINAKLGKD